VRVIAGSPNGLEPVARAIAESATRLCEASQAGVFRFDGLRPRPSEGGLLIGRTLLERQVLHVPDVGIDPAYEHAIRLGPAIGMRTFLGVPMLRSGASVGVSALIRSEVAPFSQRPIALVRIPHRSCRSMVGAMARPRPGRGQDP
jgi:GAF domain-containing protein